MEKKIITKADVKDGKYTGGALDFEGNIELEEGLDDVIAWFREGGRSG